MTESLDLDILDYLKHRDVYKQQSGVVKKNKHVLTDEARTIIWAMEPFFEQFPEEQTIDWRKFSAWFRTVRFPNKKEEELKLFSKLFDRLHAFTPDELQESIVSALRERGIAEELISILEQIAVGSTKWGLEDVAGKLKTWEADQPSEAESFIVDSDLEDLVGGVLGEGLNWKQRWMNQACGPLRKGDLVGLLARPDSGKTSFLSGQANCFASQLKGEECGLWFNNEQEGKKVKLRIVQEAVELDNEQLNANPILAKERYQQRVGPLGRVKVVDRPGLSWREVEKLCEQYNPKFIIIDQLWKITGFGNISEVTTQTEIANWARELAKKWAPVIGVYQADGQAEGVDYIEMDRVYYSKTAVQGELDLMIAMGKVHDDTKQNIRYFHFPKHKMTGGGEFFQPDMKGHKFESVFTPETGVFV